MAKRQKLDGNVGSNIIFTLDDSKSAFQETIQETHFKMASNEDDLQKVFSQFHTIFQETLAKALTRFNGIKVSFVVTLQYKSKERKDLEPFYMYLRATAQHIFQGEEIDATIENIYKETHLRHENVQCGASNCEIQNIFYLSILIARFEPLSGAGFAPLPKFLEAKEAIINVKNHDERCFGYSILSAVLDVKRLPTTTNLAPFFSEYHLNSITYPVEPSQVPSLESKLNLKINIFSFGDDEGKMRFPLYISRYEGKNAKEVDLLYWEGHYAWIKSFSRFIYDLSGKKTAKFFCKRCFSICSSRQSYGNHQLVCNRPDFTRPLYSFPHPGSKLRFQHIQNQLKCPFVIYADFECLLSPTKKGPIKGKTVPYEAHLPAAVGFLIKASIPEYFPSRYESYTGQDSTTWFLNRLLKIAEELITFMDDEKRLVMTEEDKVVFESAMSCCICLKPFLQEEKDINPKVRDHDHLTGKYRGAAHSKCNLNFKNQRKIPVFIHNFRGYDSHLICLALERFPNEKTGVIGQGYEKYLILKFSKHIVFKDSYQFMGYSLETLCNELARSGAEKFQNLREGFANIPLEHFKLLLRKGVFPYEFFDSWQKLDETQLPPITSFYSTLKQSPCEEADYSHAQSVWKIFSCKYFKDYMELYLKTDVLILADVFENFRSFSEEHYRLDPAHYVSSPHLSWDAMLLMTNVEMDLLSDSEMFSMIDGGIRGGVSMIVHRYARANNPEMGADEYVPTLPLSYIVYLDANNLYGWAMSQQLPIGSFEWIFEKEWKNINWKLLPDESAIGYFITCDLEYPEELHDLHQDYPLAPEKRQIHGNRYNEKQLNLLAKYSQARSTLNVTKLICHFLPHRRYTIHYRNLKFYLEEGLRLTKIYKVLKFQQSAWLAPYIKTNQQLRAVAKSDFEKNQPKLFNNSIYGKTCENQKKRTDFIITKTKQSCKRLIEKPQTKGWKIFTENLAAFELQKIRATIDKPFYVGFSVLELSKLHMYMFHYRFIKARFGAKAQLLLTDTDSLMYHIKDQNPYEVFYSERMAYFDFASFPKQHKYFDDRNNKVIGMFKDEAEGKQIKEVVGLRPKMYSILFAGEEKKEKHTAKGVQYAVSKKLRHQDFLKQFDAPFENRQINRRIGSKLHQIFSFETSKRGLCAFDDKRVIMDDGITTYPYGHHLVANTASAIDESPEDTAMIIAAPTAPVSCEDETTDQEEQEECDEIETEPNDFAF